MKIAEFGSKAKKRENCRFWFQSKNEAKVNVKEMAKQTALVLVASLLEGVHAFMFGTGSMPGLRARGVTALTMSDKSDQVVHRDAPHPITQQQNKFDFTL